MRAGFLRSFTAFSSKADLKKAWDHRKQAFNPRANVVREQKDNVMKLTIFLTFVSIP
jgi:hypothetical protein